MMDVSTAISIKDLRVSFGDNEVLHQIGGDIEAGRWLAPVGPNGAGKSTLLRAIAGLNDFAGRITINGKAAQDLGRKELARLVAYVPQRPELPPQMTVHDYVMLGRTPHLSYFEMEKRHDRELVAEVLDRLALASFAHRHLGEISGGEAQRAVVGRALAQGAPIMLLDEPTSSLDLGRQQQVFELIDELRHERLLTIVSAVHDLTLASQFADELWLMDEGAIVSKGSPKEVLNAETIFSLYGATVDVHTDESGDIVVIPRRKKR